MIVLCYLTLILTQSSEACAIELEDWVVVTGGHGPSSYTRYVKLYNISGFVLDLPDLNQGRWDHGCGHYLDNNNEIVRNLLQQAKKAHHTSHDKIESVDLVDFQSQSIIDLS